MSCWTALSLLLVGCFLVLEVDGRLSIAMHPKDAFYYIAKDILGVCSDDSSTTSAEDLTLYVEDNSHPCHSGPESDQNDDQKLDPNFGTVTSNTNGSKSFKIESTELRMYNIWCVTGSSSICSYALIYDLNITETDTALSCNLRMAKDVPNEFEIPSKVEWYMNGAPMEPPVELILTRDDFVVESNEVVAFSFPLNFEDKKLGGVYECKFNTDKQVFDYEYEVLGEIKESYIRFDPEQEQYIDGDKVEMTCAFTGYPAPNISWYRDEVLLDGSQSRLEGEETISTYTIPVIEDSEHRGTYMCKAGNASTADKVLRVRDKLAPLWPFLGIVVQVIVLAICIAIGEKFRKKKLEEKKRRRELHQDVSAGTTST